jgi:DNA-3-methyladenine glycosylase
MERYPLRAEKNVILPRSFYNRSSSDVARGLLGKLLVHGPVSGIIVETEAYPGGDDLASHSAAGITDRTRVIFGPPGHAYVYLSYGMHECLNIVAGPKGTAGCVLIRALEPVDGIGIMRSRRPRARHDRDLANGPGKLTQALAITRRHYGVDVTRGSLVVRDRPSIPDPEIAVSARIGITKCPDLLLRFTISGNSFLSQL